jgi:3',5'-cyclic AMP phosphodiesterase CpdA
VLLDAPMFTVPSDPARHRVTTREWIAAHLASPGLPDGHGFSAAAARDGRAWYAFDAGPLRCLMLDTVNPYGGWQGSLDQEQFGWLAAELADARRQGTLGCLLFSHHPLDSLDHDGLTDPRAGALDDPLTLAGWSRELSANRWQSASDAAGGAADRNVILA